MGAGDEDLANLLRAAIGGDERAYATFLQRTAALVRRYAARRITHGGVDPEDIVQETLLAIHTKRHTWRQDRPVTPWVHAIARHKLVDAFRRRGTRLEVDVDTVADTMPAPEPDRAHPRDIDRAMGSLPPRQRSVVSAISIEGRSIGETAHEFDMSETAVRVALHRGLTAIARKFGRE